MISPKRYQTNLEPMRWSRNGMLPNAGFISGANGAIGRQNNILSYRKKTFFTAGDWDNRIEGAAGTRAVYRCYCHTGHGTTHIGFVAALGRDDKATGTDPRVNFTATISGGASTTTTVRFGLNGGTTMDPPNSIAWFRPQVAVTANTRYELLVEAVDYGRPLSVMAYEIGADEVDDSIDYFHENQVSVGYPITDNLRSSSLIGLSQMFRHNGSHLLSWPGGITAPTFTTTTWTNLLDGTSTAVSAATPGYYLGGDSDTYLSQHCRQSDGQTLDVVFAVHGSMSAGTGEVRLEDSTGTRCSITGIDTTSKWHVATTTIANVNTMGKVDLQARIAGTPPDTLTVNAVALFSYIA